MIMLNIKVRSLGWEDSSVVNGTYSFDGGPDLGSQNLLQTSYKFLLLQPQDI